MVTYLTLVFPRTDAPEAGSKEITSSWALFIMIMLLMFALFTSYILQQRKIQAVHETVLSIFAGTCNAWGATRQSFGFQVAGNRRHCRLSLLTTS